MRTMPVVLAFLVANVFSTVIIAQNATDAEALAFAEKMPEYPGGVQTLMNDVVAKLVYPKQCADSNIQGKVFLHFVVTEDGGIGKVEIIRGPHPLLNQAAVDALKALDKKFAPGMQGGKPAKVWFSLPINFKIAADPAPELSESKGVDAEPAFPGGNEGLMKFIKENTVYPADEKANGIKGKVVVKFMIDTDGSVKDIKVTRSVSLGLDNEAMRVISMLPKFKPAKQNGVPVSTYISMPVLFNN